MSGLNNRAENHTFVMYVGQEDAYYKLLLSNEKLLDAVFANDHPEWRHLDAGILHSAIIHKILGIHSTDVAYKGICEICKGRNRGCIAGEVWSIPVGLLSETHPH